MMSEKIFRNFVWFLTCSLLFAAGCADTGEEAAAPVEAPQTPARAVEPKATQEAPVEKPQPKPEPTPEKTPPKDTVTVALKFTPGDTTTYKVTTETQKSVKFEGPMALDPQFQGGITGNKVEIVFAREIKSVDEQGNALAGITIKQLKYSSTQKGKPGLEFDSSKNADADSPLAKLLGQGYTIKISPQGKVDEIIEIDHARAIARGPSEAHRTATTLLDSAAIRERHGAASLPAADKNQVRSGDTWSSMKTFEFRMMGPKTYEKIFTVTNVEAHEGGKLVTAEMNAAPTSAAGDNQAAANALSKMMDENAEYAGELCIDTTKGKIEKYAEKLQLGWVMVDPSGGATDQPPNAIRMGAMRTYALEKID